MARVSLAIFLARGKNLNLIKTKQKRMAVIVLNGLCILLPSAIYLYTLSVDNQFGHVFYGVQTLELIAGFANIILISMNIRDGLKLSKNRSH